MVDESREGGLAEGTEPAPVETGVDDWTNVVIDGCNECGFDPDYDVRDTGQRLRATIPQWEAVLDRRDVRQRPGEGAWSPLEHGYHVRDVNEIFRGRLDLMLAQDDPTFLNWDQDAAAVRAKYGSQDSPDEVAESYRREATQTADQWDAVRDDEWGRRGLRDNGSAFTIETFAKYFMHDIHHHTKAVGA